MDKTEKALEALRTDLEGKTKDQIEAQIKEFQDNFDKDVEEKVKGLVGDEVKIATEALKKEHEDAMDAMQKHLDAMDVRIQARKSGEKAGYRNWMKELLKENFDKIVNVEKRGGQLRLDVKVVADMTLGTHLTGDQPRDYSFIVAKVPGQLFNVSDLIASISIFGGTYTFPRETGSEGSISTQTEGSDKSQKDYDIEMIDVNTDFLAGFTVYSKKMANNLPFLESFLPDALRRDYFIAENALFNTVLAAGVTASVQIITGQNKVEMLIQEIATLEGINFAPNAIVVTPADFWDILVTEKSTGAGYGLPGVVTMDAGQLRINGIPIFKANWVAADKYYVGDWTMVKKVVTEGLSVQFSNEDSDNFRKNNITARIEAQIGLAIERTDALIFGDFTAV